jgi:hypothetical protein
LRRPSTRTWFRETVDVRLTGRSATLHGRVHLLIVMNAVVSLAVTALFWTPVVP